MTELEGALGEDYEDAEDIDAALEEVEQLSRKERIAAAREDRKRAELAAKARWLDAHEAAIAAGLPDPEPVTIVHQMDHEFEQKPGNKRGCARCGLYKKDMVHHAYPASFNAGGSSRDPRAWQTEKKLWMAFFRAELEKAGLPLGLSRVLVEGRLTFPTKRMNRGPDQGNYRHPIEKHLGDALQTGSWLEDDNWLAYNVGNLGWAYEKDVRKLELTFFGMWLPEELAEAGHAPALF